MSTEPVSVPPAVPPKKRNNIGTVRLKAKAVMRWLPAEKTRRIRCFWWKRRRKLSPQGTVTPESVRFMSPHLNVYSVSYRSGAAEFKATPKSAKR